MGLGVAANLCFLGYFKYKNFFLDSLNYLAGTDLELIAVILPLGISFITFQKIAFPGRRAVRHRRRLRCGGLPHVRVLLPAADRRSDRALPGNDAAVQAGGPRADRERLGRGALAVLDGPCSRRSCSPTASRRTCRPPSTARRTARPSRSSPRGSRRSATRSRSTSTSRATRTWRSARRDCSVSVCRTTSTRR